MFLFDVFAVIFLFSDICSKFPVSSLSVFDESESLESLKFFEDFFMLPDLFLLELNDPVSLIGLIFSDSRLRYVILLRSLLSGVLAFNVGF